MRKMKVTYGEDVLKNGKPGKRRFAMLVPPLKAVVTSSLLHKGDISMKTGYTSSDSRAYTTWTIASVEKC